MTTHPTATREAWLAARLALLEAEKALTRRSDEVARQRQALPWMRIDKTYRFDTEAGEATLADLFAGRSQLMVYHFMFGPDYKAGCPSCSAIADGFNGIADHLANHDVPEVEGGGDTAENQVAAMCGTDTATFHRDRPGMSAFVMEDGVIYHTYSTFARGLDALWSMYQWLDRAPKGRNETGVWWRRHDEYAPR